MKKFVYADNAATTKITQPVLDAMLPWLTEGYGNASSIYSKGREALKALNSARETVAGCLGAKPEEIFFTSGGSEADNWAIKGVAHTMAKKGKKASYHLCVRASRSPSHDGCPAQRGI